jgi:hypothetical protein
MLLGNIPISPDEVKKRLAASRRALKKYDRMPRGGVLS